MDKLALPWPESRGLWIAVWAYFMDPARRVEAFGRTWPVRIRPLLWALAGFILVEIALMVATYARYRRRPGGRAGAP